MAKVFEFGEDELILFFGWRTDQSWKFGVSMVGIFFWCILHEYISAMRGNLEVSIKVAAKGKDKSCLYGKSAELTHFLASLLYLVHVVSTYLLMLIAMKYNVGLFAILVVGFAAGFLLFRKSNSNYYSSEVCCAA